MFNVAKEPKYEIDHSKLICVCQGKDKLTGIGDPPQPGDMSLEQAWTMSIESYFPLQNSLAEDDQSKVLGDVRKYSELKVDSMRQQKDDELERYRKEAEMQKRFEKQKQGKKLVVKKVIKKPKFNGE